MNRKNRIATNIKVSLLCEGPCSTNLPYTLAEELEKQRFEHVEGDPHERAKVARQSMTTKLKWKPHSFKRAEQHGGRVDFIFACNDCGTLRSFGAVASMDSNLRAMYFSAKAG